jgi:hypothetical protein
MQEQKDDFDFFSEKKMSTIELFNRIILWGYKEAMKFHTSGDIDAYVKAVNDLEDSMLAYHDSGYEKDLKKLAPFKKEVERIKGLHNLDEIDKKKLAESIYNIARIKFKAISLLMVRHNFTPPVKIIGIIDDKTEERLWSKN